MLRLHVVILKYWRIISANYIAAFRRGDIVPETYLGRFFALDA
jgi:hypothetical protein